MIEFDAVSRAYGGRLAVDKLSLVVPRGELFALLGANGAGKTTTIKMLIGLLRPTAGTVRVCSYDVGDTARPAAHCLGYVPDEPFLYEKLSGREFLEFVAAMHRIEPCNIAAAIAAQNEYFELGEFLDDLAETYTHGMRQRLALAAALVHDPTVLVIDEPMIGLDPRSARLVKNMLTSRAAAGTTVFMSTHTLSLAEEIADRIGILDCGRLKFLGTMSELRQALAAPGASLEPLFLELTQGNGAAHRNAACQPRRTTQEG